MLLQFYSSQYYTNWRLERLLQVQKLSSFWGAKDSDFLGHAKLLYFTASIKVLRWLMTCDHGAHTVHDSRLPLRLRTLLGCSINIVQYNRSTMLICHASMVAGGARDHQGAVLVAIVVNNAWPKQLLHDSCVSGQANLPKQTSGCHGLMDATAGRRELLEKMEWTNMITSSIELLSEEDKKTPGLLSPTATALNLCFAMQKLLTLISTGSCATPNACS